MGTQEEEAAALHRIQQEAVAREAAAIRAEAERKAAEAAKNQNRMVAEEPGRLTGEAWPETSAEPSSPGLMSTVAGKLCFR
jgi:hypothetical protein